MSASETRLPIDDEADDQELLDAVSTNDPTAWSALVRRHFQPLILIAQLYVADDDRAADVARDTLSAALAGLDRFDRRWSFRAWLYQILATQVRQRAAEEIGISFSSTIRLFDDPYDGAVDPDRLRPASDPVAPLHWASPPPRWDPALRPDRLSGELRNILETAIETLSPSQREVITLRDVLGWTPTETASALGITETSQRVLLHRARSVLRNGLEEHLTT